MISLQVFCGAEEACSPSSKARSHMKTTNQNSLNFATEALSSAHKREFLSRIRWIALSIHAAQLCEVLLSCCSQAHSQHTASSVCHLQALVVKQTTPPLLFVYARFTVTTLIQNLPFKLNFLISMVISCRFVPI